MRLAHLQLAAALAMVGANVAVAKAASPLLPVFVFALVRFVVAAVVLAPLTWKEAGPPLRRLPLRDWRELFLGRRCSACCSICSSCFMV